MHIPTEDELANARARREASYCYKMAAIAQHDEAVKRENRLNEVAGAVESLVKDVVSVFLERGYSENRAFYALHVRKTLEQVEDGSAITAEALYERTKRVLQERTVLARRPFLKEEIVVCHSHPTAW